MRRAAMPPGPARFFAAARIIPAFFVQVAAQQEEPVVGS